MNLETVSFPLERPEATSHQAVDLTEPTALSHSRFLSFTIGSGRYCLPAEAVVEVSHPLDIARLPKSSANVLGAASFTGEIALVVDLRSLLNESRPSVDTKPKMLRLAVIGDQSNIAFPVDAVGEVFSSEPSAFFPAGGAPLVEGTQNGALTHPVSLLNPTAIRAIPDPRSTYLA